MTAPVGSDTGAAHPAAPARPAAPTGGSPGPADFDRRLIAPMILGSVLNPVNSSIIAVSLVPIGIAFGAPPSATTWLVSALYLATAIGQPVVGRLVDVHGPRRLFLAGSGLVGLAGLLGALAPDLGVLIAARVLLGFGTCAGYPAAMYLIRSEGRRTGRDSPAGVLTVLAVSTQTIAVVGPTLGGLLIGLGGWRATLAVNVPLAAAALVLGARRLPTPAGEAAGGTASDGRARLDPVGMLLFAGTLVCLLLFLMHPAARDWWLLLLAAALGAGLVACELRVGDPFLDLRLLAGNAALLATYLRALLAAVVSYSFLYGFTQWLQSGRGLSPSVAGLVLIPVFGAGIVVSTATGRRPEIRGKLVLGAAAQVVACALLTLVAPGTGLWLLLVVGLVMGVPQGLVNLANQNAVYHQSDPARTASSAGLLRTFFYLGAIVASAATGVSFGPRVDTAGMHHLAWFMGFVAVLFLAVTLADRSLRRVGRPA